MVRIPNRSFRKALRYWRPYRLTLKSNPPIYAWLWWNFQLYGEDGVKPFWLVLYKWIDNWVYILPHPSLYGWYIQNLRTEWRWRGVEWWHRY